MIPAFLAPLVGPAVNKVLDLIPNKNERERARESVEASFTEGILAAAAAQTSINEVEAQHKSVFVSGWRPWCGWVCGFALAWNYIIQPIAAWVGFLAGYDLSGAPRLDTSELTTILMGMLGLVGARSYEKLKGVSRSS